MGQMIQKFAGIRGWIVGAILLNGPPIMHAYCDRLEYNCH